MEQNIYKPIRLFSSLTPNTDDYIYNMRIVLPHIPKSMTRDFLFGTKDAKGNLVVYTCPLAYHQIGDLSFFDDTNKERITLSDLYRKDKRQWEELTKEFAAEWKAIAIKEQKESRHRKAVDRIKSCLMAAQERKEPVNI